MRATAWASSRTTFTFAVPAPSATTALAAATWNTFSPTAMSRIGTVPSPIAPSAVAAPVVRLTEYRPTTVPTCVLRNAALAGVMSKPTLPTAMIPDGPTALSVPLLGGFWIASWSVV
jgi:hypothetical protein